MSFKWTIALVSTLAFLLSSPAASGIEKTSLPKLLDPDEPAVGRPAHRSEAGEGHGGHLRSSGAKAILEPCVW